MPSTTPFFFTIEGFSEQEIMEKLRREHPTTYLDAMTLGTKEKSVPRFLGLGKRKKYVISFVIRDKRKAVATAVSKIQEKSRTVSTLPSSRMVSDLDKVKRAISLIEGGQSPSARQAPILSSVPVRRSLASVGYPAAPVRAETRVVPREDSDQDRFLDLTVAEVREYERTQSFRDRIEREPVEPETRREFADEEADVPACEPSPSVRPAPRQDPGREALAVRLRDQGVEETLVERVLSEIPATTIPAEDPQRWRPFLSEALGRIVKFRPALRFEEVCPRIVLFAGPTGVGKTTTLVKLSADAFRNQIPLRFMTNDTYRVGATGQLESYTNIMGAPLDIVNTVEEFNERFSAARERIVFVDTAGRSPRDDLRQAELRKFLSGLALRDHRLETFLVLAMTTDQADMEETVGSFSFLNPSGIILTKTDESRRRGKILNLLHATGLEAAYFTYGQSVPEDIMPATADGLAGMILS